MRALAAVLVFGLAGLGCRTEAEKLLVVEEAHVEKGEGVSLIGGGGAQVGHSVMVVGSLRNADTKRTAFNVHLEVKLFRAAGDTKPARIYGDEFSVKGLERVEPGKTATFRHYVKTSLGGYEVCEVRAVSATFR